MYEENNGGLISNLKGWCFEKWHVQCTVYSVQCTVYGVHIKIFDFTMFVFLYVWNPGEYLIYPKTYWKCFQNHHLKYIINFVIVSGTNSTEWWRCSYVVCLHLIFNIQHSLHNQEINKINKFSNSKSCV